jgi:2-polyprenyl-6-methoxyphenol hydroxylase-like FAD-dependent oxidoreductase
MTGFAQDDTSVDVALSDRQSLRAKYLVGCDGGCSLIRTAASIAFPGRDPTTSNLITEVELAEEPAWGPTPRRAQDPFREQDEGWGSSEPLRRSVENKGGSGWATTC